MNLLYELLHFKNKHNFKTNYEYKGKYLLSGGSSYTVKINKLLEDKNKIVFKEIYNDNKRKIILNTEKVNNCIVITLFDNKATLEKLQVSENKCIDLDDFGLKTTGKFHLKVAI